MRIIKILSRLSTVFFGLGIVLLAAQSSFAVVGDIAIYTNVGETAETIDTGNFNHDWNTTAAHVDGSYSLVGTNNAINLSEGGHYMVLYNSRFDDPDDAVANAKLRSEVQSRLVVGGVEIATGWSQGYIRRQDDDFECITAGGGIIDAAAGNWLRLRSSRTDAKGETVTREPGASGIQVLKLDDTWDYLSLARTGTDQAGPTGNVEATDWVPVQYNAQNELDTGSFAHDASIDPQNVTLKTPGHYMVFANTYGWRASNDNREMLKHRLTLDGAEVAGSLSTVYLRGNVDSSNALEGAAAIGMIIETTAANQVLNVEGILDVNIPVTYKADKTALTIVKLPDAGDYIRLDDSGTDNFNPAATTAMGWDTELEFDVAGPFTHADSQVGVTTTDDYLFFNALYDRDDAVQRGKYYQRWRENGGTPFVWGQSGRYSRNNGGVDAVGNWSGLLNPEMDAGDYIEVVSEALGNSGAMSADVKGLQGVRLWSLFATTLTWDDATVPEDAWTAINWKSPTAPGVETVVAPSGGENHVVNGGKVLVNAAIPAANSVIINGGEVEIQDTFTLEAGTAILDGGVLDVQAGGALDTALVHANTGTLNVDGTVDAEAVTVAAGAALNVGALGVLAADSLNTAGTNTTGLGATVTVGDSLTVGSSLDMTTGNLTVAGAAVSVADTGTLKITGDFSAAAAPTRVTLAGSATLETSGATVFDDNTKLTAPADSTIRVLNGSLTLSASPGIPDGTIAYYPFDADFTDQSSNATVYDGTNAGAAGVSITSTPGEYKVGAGAANFPGDSFIDLPDGFADFDDGISVAAWVRTTNFRQWSRVIDFGNGAGLDNILLARNNVGDDLRWQFHDTAGGSEQLDYADVFPLNDWVHVVGTCDAGPTDGSIMKVYVNGVNVQTTTDGTVPGNIKRINNYIGESGWDADDFFEGQYDELYVIGRAITDDEVSALYGVTDFVDFGHLALGPDARLINTGGPISFNSVTGGSAGVTDITSAAGVEIRGIVAPGNSTGTLEIEGPLTLLAASAYNWGLGDGSQDLISMKGAASDLTIADGMTLVLMSDGASLSDYRNKFDLFTIDGGSLDLGAVVIDDSQVSWNTTYARIDSDADSVYIEGVIVATKAGDKTRDFEATGTWDDTQWTDASNPNLGYGAIVDSAAVVTVDNPPASPAGAYSLTLSGNGQVLVADGAQLDVLDDTNVGTDGTLEAVGTGVFNTVRLENTDGTINFQDTSTMTVIGDMTLGGGTTTLASGVTLDVSGTILANGGTLNANGTDLGDIPIVINGADVASTAGLDLGNTTLTSGSIAATGALAAANLAANGGTVDAAGITINPGNLSVAGAAVASTGPVAVTGDVNFSGGGSLGVAGGALSATSVNVSDSSLDLGADGAAATTDMNFANSTLTTSGNVTAGGDLSFDGGTINASGPATTISAANVLVSNDPDLNVTGAGSLLTIDLPDSTPLPAVAGLRLHLDAFHGPADVGGTMVWADQSGQGNDVQQTDNLLWPTLIVDGGVEVSHSPVVRFEQDDYLIRPDSLGFTGAPDMTVFILANAGVGSSGSPRAVHLGVVGEDNSGKSIAFASDSSFRYNNGNRIFANDSFYDEWTIGTYLRGSIPPTFDNVHFFKNGVEATMTGETNPGNTLDITPTTGTLETLIGAGRQSAGVTLNDLWAGDMAEILVFDSQLSDLDRMAVEAYLVAKYSIPTFGALDMEASATLKLGTGGTGQAKFGSITTGDGATISGEVIALGAVNPGGSAGTLNVDGVFVMETTSTYNWELDATPANDLIVVSGELELIDGWNLVLTDAGGTPTPGEARQLFSYTPGELTGGDAGSSMVSNVNITQVPAWGDAIVRYDDVAGEVYMQVVEDLLWDTATTDAWNTANWNRTPVAPPEGFERMTIDHPDAVVNVAQDNANTTNGTPAMRVDLNAGRLDIDALPAVVTLDVVSDPNVAGSGIVNVAGGAELNVNGNLNAVVLNTLTDAELNVNGNLNADVLNTAGNTTFAAGSGGTISTINVTGGTTEMASPTVTDLNVSAGILTALGSGGPPATTLSSVGTLNVSGTGAVDSTAGVLSPTTVDISGGTVTTAGVDATNLNLTGGELISTADVDAGSMDFAGGTLTSSGIVSVTAGSMNIANAPNLNVTGGQLTIQLPAVGAVPLGSLRGYYPFDGDLLDDSAQGRDGTAAGDPTFVGGHVGQAVALDGVGDGVNLDAHYYNEFDQKTIAMWIRQDNATGDQTLFDIGGATNGFGLLVRSGVLEAGAANGGVRPSITDTSAIDLSTGFHHVVVTYGDGTSMLRLYVDGQEFVSADTGLGQIAANTNGAGIGYRNGAAYHNTTLVPDFFTGLVDEVYVYDRALDADEVNLLRLGSSGGSLFGDLTMNAGASLELTGGGVAAFESIVAGDLCTIDGDVVSLQTLNPVDGTIGTLNVTGDFIVGEGSTYICDLSPAPDSDLVDVTGELDATANWGVQLSPNGAPAAGANVYTILNAGSVKDAAIGTVVVTTDPDSPYSGLLELPAVPGVLGNNVTVTVMATDSREWTDANPNDWTNVASWDGGVPAADEGAILTGAGLATVSSVVAAPCTVIVDGGATNVTTGGDLQVGNNLWVVNGGTFSADAGTVGVGGKLDTQATLDLSGTAAVTVTGDLNSSGATTIAGGATLGAASADISAGSVAVNDTATLDVTGGGVGVAPGASLAVAAGATINAATVTTAGTTTFAAGSLGTIGDLIVTGGTTNVSSPAITNINATGGILNTAANVPTMVVNGAEVTMTAAATVNDVSVTNGSLGFDPGGGVLSVDNMNVVAPGVVNTGAHAVEVFETLNLGDVTYSVAAGSFQAAGADLATNVGTVTLKGGLVTIATPTSPDAHWGFNEGPGAAVAIDSSGNAHDGTINGAITGEPGQIGNAYLFDGTDDVIDIVGYSGVTGTQPRSMAAWIKTTKNEVGILSWGLNSTGQKWVFRTQTDNGLPQTIRVEVNGGYRVGSTDVIDDEWHHVVAVLPSPADNVNQMKLYVDGVLEANSATKGQAINTAVRDVQIGNEHNNQHFLGLMDEVFIYDRALSDTEVLSLYRDNSANTIDLSGMDVVVDADSGISTTEHLELGDLTINGPDLTFAIDGTRATFQRATLDDSSPSVNIGGSGTAILTGAAGLDAGYEDGVSAGTEEINIIGIGEVILGKATTGLSPAALFSVNGGGTLTAGLPGALGSADVMIESPAGGTVLLSSQGGNAVYGNAVSVASGTAGSIIAGKSATAGGVDGPLTVTLDSVAVAGDASVTLGGADAYTLDVTAAVDDGAAGRGGNVVVSQGTVNTHGLNAGDVSIAAGATLDAGGVNIDVDALDVAGSFNNYADVTVTNSLHLHGDSDLTMTGKVLTATAAAITVGDGRTLTLDPAPITARSIDVSSTGIMDTGGNVDLTLSESLKVPQAAFTLSGGAPGASFQAAWNNAAEMVDSLTLSDGTLAIAVPTPADAHWTFDEGPGAGVAIDSTVNGHDGTINGAISGQPGQFGNAYLFDGTDDVINITGYSGVTGTTPRTMAVWIKTTDNAGAILSWGLDNTGEKWIFRTTAANDSIRVEVSGAGQEATTPVTDDAWHHVVAVLPEPADNCNLMKFYIDGVPEAISTTGNQAINTAVRDVWIGNGHANRRFAGVMDEVFIYDRALDDAEVLSLYNYNTASPIDLGGVNVNVDDDSGISTGELIELGDLTINGDRTFAIDGVGATFQSTTLAGSPFAVSIDGTGTALLTGAAGFDAGGAEEINIVGSGEVILGKATTNLAPAFSLFRLEGGGTLTAGLPEALGTADFNIEDSGGTVLLSSQGGNITYDNAVSVATLPSAEAAIIAGKSAMAGGVDGAAGSPTVTLGSGSKTLAVQNTSVLTLGSTDGYTLRVASDIDNGVGNPGGALAVEQGTVQLEGDTAVTLFEVSGGAVSVNAPLSAGALEVSSGAVATTAAGPITADEVEVSGTGAVSLGADMAVSTNITVRNQLMEAGTNRVTVAESGTMTFSNASYTQTTLTAETGSFQATGDIGMYGAETIILGGTGSVLTVESADMVPLKVQSIGTDTNVNFPAGGSLAADTDTASFAVTASGNDIWGTADGLYFAYQEFDVTEPFDITARVGVGGFVGGTNAWRKAGLMVRDSLADISRNAFTLIAEADGNGINGQMRREDNVASIGCNTDPANGSKIGQRFPHAEPVYLRLEYLGDGQSVNYYWSDDLDLPDPWTLINDPAWDTAGNVASPTLLTTPMTDTIYVGLAVTSHNVAEQTTATFDGLSGFTTYNPATRFENITGPGTIDGDIIIGGEMAPGSSLGTIEVLGDVTFADGSALHIEVQGIDGSDLLAVDGALDLTSTSDTLRLEWLPELGNPGSMFGGTYTIATYLDTSPLAGEEFDLLDWVNIGDVYLDEIIYDEDQLDGTFGIEVTLHDLLLGDINIDGYVNTVDLDVMGDPANWDQSGDWFAGDLNFDGEVNLADLAILGHPDNWNNQLAGLPPVPQVPFNPTFVVPEPSTVVLLTMALLGLLAVGLHRRKSG